MLRLLKLLLLLNPLRLLALGARITTLRRKLQFLGFVLAAATALHIHIMPDWLAALVAKIADTANSIAGNSHVASGGKPSVRQNMAQPAFDRPIPSTGNASGPETLSRGRLFAALADLHLSQEQINRLPDSHPPPDAVPVNVRWLQIDRVLDGNTLVVAGQTVRLIGVDAPEAAENRHFFNELNRVGAREQANDMLYLGRQAARFLRQAEGRRCWLQQEERPHDQFGRILAYVHLDDGISLGEALIYQGFAKAYLGANFRYAKRYVQLQQEAMRRRHGLWGEP